MKTSTTLSARLLAILLVCNAALVSAETKLPENITAELSALEGVRERDYAEALEAVTDLNEKYLAALTNTKGAAQKAGELEKFMADEAEIKRLNSSAEDNDLPKDAEVARLKKAYITNLSVRKKAITIKNAQADQKYAAALDLLVADLTKEGKIEEAKLLLQHKNRPTKAVAQEPEIDVKPPVVAPPPVAPKPAAGPGSIIGTTWRIQYDKGFTITFLADGQIKEGTGDIGLHTYEIIDANKVRIRWGKTSGRFEKKNYEIDGMRTTMKGIADGSEWKRIGDAIE